MNSIFSHVALLVPSVEASAAFLNSQKIKTNDPEIFESEGTKEVYVGDYGTQNGLLLLLEALSEGPYKTSFAKRGPSLHHIAVDVLSVEDFIRQAQSAGWKLHPVSSETLTYKTAWFYFEGVPTLIEAHQKKSLSSKPAQVSKILLPIQKTQMNLFEGIGLGDLVGVGHEVALVVDGKKFSFSQIAWNTPSLETSRLILRPIALTDAPSYTKNFVDYEVIRNLHKKVPWPYPETGIVDFITGHIFPLQGKDRWIWGIFQKENPHEMIGGVELWRKGSQENRGFWLGRKYWGRGLMTEAATAVTDCAFDILGFDKLYFSNALGNVGSRKIKEKTGAVYLGTASGEFVDPAFNQRELWELTKENWKKFKS